VRLRELTDYVDRLVTTDEPDEPRWERGCGAFNRIIVIRM